MRCKSQSLVYQLFTSLLIVGSWLLMFVDANGSQCSGSLTADAGASDPYWLQTITKRGASPYNDSPSTYKVFRNVKDYGAIGDGVTDDTAAINRAISEQGRCGQGCKSSTRSPAIIYFPTGTYLVSSPIIPYYYTQMIGDAKNLPTLKASAGFSGIAVIDADPYGSDGNNWWTNQNVFFKSVRHFIIDLTAMPATTSATGLHWQVSQATGLSDVTVKMSTASNTAHQGIFMENGSGGFMSDLTFIGGKYGVWVGNQQFTVRNITVQNAQTAIYAHWNWGWTWQGVTIKDCDIGFNIHTGGTTQETQSASSEVIVDANISNVRNFVQLTATVGNSLAGSLVLDNTKFTSVTNGVVDGSNVVLLTGGTKTVRQFAIGNKYSGSSATGTFVKTSIAAASKPSAILDSSANWIYNRPPPTYGQYSPAQFVSVKQYGAVGDGVTDDTTAIQNFINNYWGCKILYFDAGTYLVTSTIKIPTGSIIVGEAWSTIMGSGSYFADQANPKVVIQVGDSGDKGVIEITGMVFSTRAGAAGAIVLEWNTADTSGFKGTAAMWDVHVRLGGFAGTNLMVSQCGKNTGHTTAACTAAFLGFHIKPSASVYAEATWVWTADHSLDETDQSEGQIDVYTGRGILCESTNGPVWLIGTGSEHHVIVQYNFASTKNVYAGLIQTETPYYQPGLTAPNPFSTSSTYKDPAVSSDSMAWATSISNSQDIYIYGAGHYSFFKTYTQDCLSTWCQTSLLKVDSASTKVFVYGLSTVGIQYSLTYGSTGTILGDSNVNGFVDTVTIWSSESLSTAKKMVKRHRRHLEQPLRLGITADSF